MAKRKITPLRPMHTLTPKQKSARRYARKLGFKDERAYKAWIKKWSSVPESDPRHFNPTFRGKARENQVFRVKKIIKQTRTPAKEIRRKMELLVHTINRMSAFDFWQRYEDMIRALLKDPSTSEYDKRILRNMMQQLKEGAYVPGSMLPRPTEGMLF